MKSRFPKIGARVRVTRPAKPGYPERSVTGVVVKHWPSDGIRHTDPQTGEQWVSPDKVTVRVDERPSWWPYPNTDRFCPDLSEVTVIPEPEPGPISSSEPARFLHNVISQAERRRR